jgi:hypothetical protein
MISKSQVAKAREVSPKEKVLQGDLLYKVVVQEENLFIYIMVSLPSP